MPGESMTPHDMLEQRVAVLESKIPALETGLQHNTAITASVKADTSDLVEFVQALKSLKTLSKWIGRIFGWFGRLLQWMAPIALVAVSVWAILRGGKQP